MVKLNLGCGQDIQPGYINIDVRPGPGVDFVADVRSLPYPKDTINEIRAIDVYEHISFRESKVLLRHWIDLLTSGGILFIQTTDLDALIHYYRTSTESAAHDMHIEKSISRFFGGQDYPENTHFTCGSIHLFQI